MLKKKICKDNSSRAFTPPLKRKRKMLFLLCTYTADGQNSAGGGGLFGSLFSSCPYLFFKSRRDIFSGYIIAYWPNFAVDNQTPASTLFFPYLNFCFSRVRKKSNSYDLKQEEKWKRASIDSVDFLRDGSPPPRHCTHE